MPLICTCLEGHRWEHPGSADADATPPPCPTCGALAAAIFEDAQPTPAQPVAPFDPQMLALEPAGAPPAALAPVAAPVAIPTASSPPAAPRPHPALPQRARPETPRGSNAGPVVLTVTLAVLAFLVLSGVVGVLWFQQSARHARERAEAERRAELQRQEHLQIVAPLRQEVERAQRFEAQLRQEAERLRKADAQARQAAQAHAVQLFLIQNQIMEEKRRREGAERVLQDARNEAERLRKELVATRAKSPPPDEAKKVEAELREQLTAAKLAAERAREKADATAYGHCIALASWEAWANHPDQVGPYLRECPEGLRGWEWHYLARVYGTGPVAASPNKLPVAAVGFSADGKRVAAASFDGSVVIRDSDTGAEVARTPGWSGKNSATVFSAGGDRFASGCLLAGQPPGVKIWDMNGREVRALPGVRPRSKCLALSADGKLLATFDMIKTVSVWDVDSGKEAFTLPGGAGPVLAAAFSADGKRLATAHRPGEIKLWDAGTGRLAATFKTAGRLLSVLAFAPDGGLFATASPDQGIQLWDPTAKEGAGPVHTMPEGNRLVHALAFSPDGKSLYAIDSLGLVRVYEARSGKRLRIFPAHQHPAHGLAVSPDGARLATGSLDRTVRVWTVAPRQERLTLKGHAGPVNAVAFSPDGKLVASAGDDRTVRLRDARDGREVRTLTGHTRALARLAFCPTGKRLATVSAPAAQGTRAVEVKVWDVETGNELCALPGHTGDAVRVVFSPGGRQLAVLSPGTVKFYDPATGQEVDGFEVGGRKLGRARGMDCLAVSPDGSRFAIASTGSVQVTEVKQRNGKWETRALLLRGQATPVTDLALSADGGRLLVASGGQLVTVWDAATGNKVGTFRGSRLDLRMAALSRDGQRLVAGHGARVVLYGPANGKRLLELPGHAGLVTSVAFSPDGTRIAAGGSDGAVLIWDGAPQGAAARTAGGPAQPGAGAP
jgi:WD40 repeat protein